MTVDGAIEILSDLSSAPPYIQTYQRQDAIKLGIEALRVVKKYRELAEKDKGDIILLPGETEQ